MYNVHNNILENKQKSFSLLDFVKIFNILQWILDRHMHDRGSFACGNNHILCFTLDSRNR